MSLLLFSTIHRSPSIGLDLGDESDDLEPPIPYPPSALQDLRFLASELRKDLDTATEPRIHGSKTSVDDDSHYFRSYNENGAVYLRLTWDRDI